MSTTQTVSVYKGIETQVRVRAPGKWDSLTNHTFNSSSDTLSVTTNNYNGLSMQDTTGYNTADVLDFSNTILPWKFEYNSSLSTSRYCLMPVIYTLAISGTTVGTVSFDSSTGIASINTTQSMSCIYYPTLYGHHYGSYEICTMFRIKDMTVDNQPLLAVKDESIIMAKAVIKTSGQSMLVKVWRNSNEQEVFDESEATILPNTWYTLKLLGSGSGSRIQLEDGNNAYTLWSGSQIYNLWSNDMTWIGGCYEGTQGIVGDIDLTKTWMKKNWSSSLNDWATTVWLGTEDTDIPQAYQNVVPAQTTYNFDIVGSLAITDSAMLGLCSGFSDSNYIQSKTTNFLEVGQVFSFRITTDSDVQTAQMILKQSGFHNLYINSGNFTTYNYQTQQDEIITTVTSSTSYWFKIEFLLDSKVFSISTDGINYTNYTINDNVYSTSTGTEYLFIGYKPNDSYFKGSLYLLQTFLQENSVTTWEAITVSGGTSENLYGCLVNTTDVDYSRAIDCYVIDNDQRIVLTDDENYNEGYYLGTVVLPYHNVYSYDKGVWTKENE